MVREPTAIISGVAVAVPEGGQTSARALFRSTAGRIFRGEQSFDVMSEAHQDAILAANVTPKSRPRISERGQVPCYSSHFPEDVDVQEYQIPDPILSILSASGKMALAAGIEACVDAGLIKTIRDRPAGHMTRDTGVIFCSSFASQIHTVRAVQATTLPRKLIFQWLVGPHAQLAQLLGFRGPNVYLNGACASTSTALTVAADWLVAKRCQRVLVVASDDPAAPELLPYTAGGFITLGAISTKDVPPSPFSKNRDGLVLGAGCTAFFVETPASAWARDPRVRDVVSMPLSLVENSAYHACALDRSHLRAFWSEFWTRLSNYVHQESPENTKADWLTEIVYYSHETGTPGEKGCAATESHLLQETLGDFGAGQLLVTATKAITGHTMGVGIEDAVAVLGLRTGRSPPVTTLDTCESFSHLQFGTELKHDRSLAVRFAAGFGSQCVMLAFHRTVLVAPVPQCAESLRTCVIPVEPQTWFPSSLKLIQPSRDTCTIQ